MSHLSAVHACDNVSLTCAKKQRWMTGGGGESGANKTKERNFLCCIKGKKAVHMQCSLSRRQLPTASGSSLEAADEAQKEANSLQAAWRAQEKAAAYRATWSAAFKIDVYRRRLPEMMSKKKRKKVCTCKRKGIGGTERLEDV